MKRTLTGIAAAAMVLGTMAPVACTSSTLTTGGSKTISLDGTTLYSGVQVGNATDAGSPTTHFPTWYFQQALSEAGYTTTLIFNGHNQISYILDFDDLQRRER